MELSADQRKELLKRKRELESQIRWKEVYFIKKIAELEGRVYELQRILDEPKLSMGEE